jgi:hypothetical protein
MAGIDNRTAAQLSSAAYTKLETYSANGGIVGGVPNWQVDTSLSVSTGDNQFIVFRNTDTQQVVVGFKGTDTISQLKSDL